MSHTASEQWQPAGKFLLFGAGDAARQFVARFAIDLAQVTVVTTAGGGDFMGCAVQPVAAVDVCGFDRVVVASQYLHEIVTSLIRRNVALSNIYSFDTSSGQITALKTLQNTKPAVLYAVYDLAQNPVTFDACVFANAAEQERLRLGKDSLHMVAVLPAYGLGRPGDSAFYGGGQPQVFRDRIDHVLLPIWRLLPHCTEISVVSDRDALMTQLQGKSVFPRHYDASKPQETHKPLAMLGEAKPVAHFRAPERALNYIEQRIAAWGNRRVITLNMREYRDDPTRNNCLADWVALAESLEPEFLPVIVRDTAKAGELPLPGMERFVHLDAASMDLGVRMALYEAAYLNVFCNNGIVNLAFFNAKVRYLVFKIADESIACTNTAFLKHSLGLTRGDQALAWASNRFQRICWESDTLTVMRREIDRMVTDIEEEYGE